MSYPWNHQGYPNTSQSDNCNDNKSVEGYQNNTTSEPNISCHKDTDEKITSNIGKSDNANKSSSASSKYGRSYSGRYGSNRYGRNRDRCDTNYDRRGVKGSGSSSYRNRRRSRSYSRSRSRSESSRSRSRSKSRGYKSKSYKRSRSRSNGRRKRYSSSSSNSSQTSGTQTRKQSIKTGDREKSDSPIAESDLPSPNATSDVLEETVTAIDSTPIAKTPFKNDGSFLEMFKKMQNESMAKPETKPSTIPLVGKRRGGRVLKTGIVEKLRPADDPSNDEEPKDAWSVYMQEVKKYRQASCQDESKTRPLVK